MKKTCSLPTLVLTLLGFFLLSYSALQAADLRIGLISYWPLDATAGSTMPDSSPLANNFNISNTVSIVSGQRSNSFKFSGLATTPYLNLIHGFDDNDPKGLPLYNSPNGYSIAMWIKGPPVGNSGVTNPVNGYILAEGCSTNNNPLFIFQTMSTAFNATNSPNSNRLDLIIRSTGGATPLNHKTSSSVVFDNNWHHIAWVDERGAAKLYVDGVQDATDFSYLYAAPSNYRFNTLAVGSLVRGAVAGTHFNGLIDELAIWDRPLTQAEVQDMMNNSVPAPATPPAFGVWRTPSSSTNALGDRVNFFMGVSGGHPTTTPVTYQWYKDGTSLPDGTAAGLLLTNLTSVATNIYSVTATKLSDTSSNFAYLVVLPDPTPDLASNVVSYWPMDTIIEAPPTNTPDVYYSHTDLVLFTNMDSTALFPGAFGNGVSFGFTGPSQYGKRASGTPIYTTTNYTVSMWVNGASGQLNKQVFAEGGTNATGANGDYFLLGTENPVGGGLLDVKSSLSPSLNDKKSTQTVFDSTWHHIVWVDLNGKAKLFVDGVVDATDFTYNRSNLTLTVTAVAALYRATPANFFAGSLDELAIWNRGLTWTEIQQLHTNGVPPPAPRIPPTISQQPLGSTNHLGDRTTLTVTATGSLPLTYQWRKDGAPVADATNSTLSLFFNAVVTNDYVVVITNIANSVTSDVAHVVVLPDPAPAVQAGLLYYWPLNTVNDGPPATTPDTYSHEDLVLSAMDSSYLIPGQFGNALNFQGIQYGVRSGGFAIYLATNYTVSLWVNGFGVGQPDARVFAESSTSSGNPLFTLGTDTAGATASADVFVRTDAGTTVVNHKKSSRAVFDGTWHHLVWVDVNGAARMFVDGVLDETDFTYARGPLTLDTTAIGAILRAVAGNYFVGALDDVVLWDRALSWTEIDQLHSGAIPPQNTTLAPTIFAQPQDATNFLFASSGVSLTVLAGGTGPLYYHWRKEGVEIPALNNPTAVNNTLALTNVQTSDLGGYDVVVTNSVGAVTSRVAQVVLSSASFNLDFGLNGSPNAQPGFVELMLSTSGTTLQGVTVTVTPVGGIPLADRNRTAAPFLANNPPLLTQAQLYNDFIFGNNNATVGAGVDILLEHLTPNIVFGLTVWSFDRQSTTPRVSDWSDLTTGTSVAITNGYAFDGNAPPTRDYDNTFGGLVTSSADGKLEFQGVTSALGTNFCVFLNALRLAPNPVVRITSVQLLNGNLRLIVEAQYPNEAVTFEQRPLLESGTWAPAVGGTIVETHGPMVTADFPIGVGTMFYRAVATH